MYRARSQTSGEIVALKLIDQDALRASPKAFTNLQREIAALEKVNGHPNIVCTKAVAYDVAKPRKRRAGMVRRCVMIAMELATGGELFDYLMLGRFPDSLSRTYFRQMMDALQFAHSRGVSHRCVLGVLGRAGRTMARHAPALMPGLLSHPACLPSAPVRLPAAT